MTITDVVALLTSLIGSGFVRTVVWPFIKNYLETRLKQGEREAVAQEQIAELVKETRGDIGDLKVAVHDVLTIQGTMREDLAALKAVRGLKERAAQNGTGQ